LPCSTLGTPVTTSAVSRQSFARALLASALAFILVAVAISWWLATEHSDSLAILPFTYASNDPQLMANPDREYLSDGLTESIINNLSQLANLKVIARSSVFRYKCKLNQPTINRPESKNLSSAVLRTDAL